MDATRVQETEDAPGQVGGATRARTLGGDHGCPTRSTSNPRKGLVHGRTEMERTRSEKCCCEDRDLHDRGYAALRLCCVACSIIPAPGGGVVVQGVRWSGGESVAHY